MQRNCGSFEWNEWIFDYIFNPITSLLSIIGFMKPYKKQLYEKRIY